MVIIHSSRCLDYAAPGHPENPKRVRRAVALLRRGRHTWEEPRPCAEVDLLRVHTPAHVEAVRSGAYSDFDTPHFPQIDELARLAAGGAIQASEQAWAGRPAFSLMRPPGHHAERNRIMGFCYFNNLAVAVARLLDQGSRSAPHRVAILDFDCHHGNGTEDIFWKDSRVRFVSLHQSPGYPGSGQQSAANCLNYPLAPGTLPGQYLDTLGQALGKIGEFHPELLAVSAGFDAYKLDPITHLGLEIDTFGEIGARVGRFCRHGSPHGVIPCFAVLEGGYADDFDQCVAAFVDGWEGEGSAPAVPAPPSR